MNQGQQASMLATSERENFEKQNSSKISISFPDMNDKEMGEPYAIQHTR